MKWIIVDLLPNEGKNDFQERLTIDIDDIEHVHQKAEYTEIRLKNSRPGGISCVQVTDALVDIISAIYHGSTLESAEKAVGNMSPAVILDVRELAD
jgi:hypothetical protein